MKRSEFIAPVGSAAVEHVIGDVLHRAARISPEAPILRVVAADGTETAWTAAGLVADAERVAGMLLDSHRQGARVATCLPNGAEAVLLQMGVALAGMVLVPINPKVRPPEMRHALELSGAECIYVAPEVGDHRPGEMARDVSADLPTLLDVRVCTGDWQSLLGAAPSSLPSVGPGDLAQVQFTSGTTGFPKGVQISHAGMVATSRAFKERIGLPEGGAWLNPMPLFHTAGNVLGVMGSLWQRSEHIVLSFDPELLVRTLARHPVTLLSAAPTLLDFLMSRPELATVPKDDLKVVFTGGQTVTPSFVDRVEDAFGVPLITTFGMTETCGSALLHAPTDSPAMRRNTVGRPLEGTDVRVADAGGDAVELGSVGELWLRGERLTRGYYRDPQATAATIDADGWLHTGDLAVMADAGACRIVGRLKDMIKSGGENVSPDEVEDVLVRHPDVARASVVGAADDRWGERVVAFVIPTPGSSVDAKALEAHCRNLLSPFKVPREWRLIDELPITPSGKVQRAELRRLAAAPATAP